MGKIKYERVVTNHSGIKMENATVTITPPTGVSLLVATSNIAPFNSSTFVWGPFDVPPYTSYILAAEWQVDDENEAPFTFTEELEYDGDESDPTPSDLIGSKTYTLADIYPCPECGPPTMTLNDTTWSKISGVIDFEADPGTCDIEFTVVAMSEVNIDELTLDAATGEYELTLVDEYSPWEFQVEGNFINCDEWCNGSNSVGPFGPITVDGPGTCCNPETSIVEEAFDDLTSGTSVTLSSSALEVKEVFRNGLRQSTTEWTFSSPTTVNVSDAFSVGTGAEGESLIVVYVEL